MVCWPDDICCSTNFRLRSSTDRKLSMLTQMAFLVNVVSVCVRIVRCPRWRETLVIPDRHRCCWTNLSPPLLWSIRWMPIFYLNYPGETWVAATYLDEVTADVPPAGSEPDLITASRLGKTLTTVREWVQSGLAPSWSDCAGLSPELRSWQLQFGNVSIDSEGRLWRWWNGVLCGRDR